jgi:hypothetical protein
MAKKEFTVTAEMLTAWTLIPITFNQCKALKTIIPNVPAAQLKLLNSEMAKLLAVASVRDSDGRWTNLRTDNGKFTKADGSNLIQALNLAMAGTVVDSAPVPPLVAATPVKSAKPVTNSEFSDADEMRIGTLVELLGLSRDAAIATLIDAGKISPIVETHELAPGVYSPSELPEEFKLEVYTVNVKGGGTKTRIREFKN